MVDILAPENDKKRLIVLIIVLIVVTILSLVYKNFFLTPVEVPQIGTSQQNTETDQNVTPKIATPEELKAKALEIEKTGVTPTVATPEELKAKALEIEKTN